MTAARRLWCVLLLLALGALATSAGVPLYDGVGFPDEPYRYVQPPPGVEHGPPPAGATATAPLTGGVNQLFGVQTDEQGPQLALYLPEGALRAAPGAARITVTATPLAPEAATHFGPVVGNVYRLAVSGEGGPVAPAAEADRSSLALRAPAALAQPVGVYRTGGAGHWTRLETGQAGADLYTMDFRGPGDYALVDGAATPAGSSGEAGGSVAGSLRALAALLTGFVVLLVAVAVLARTRGRSALRRPGGSAGREG